MHQHVGELTPSTSIRSAEGPRNGLRRRARCEHTEASGRVLRRCEQGMVSLHGCRKLYAVCDPTTLIEFWYAKTLTTRI